MPLIDSHCHLDFPDFEDELDDVIIRAINADISHILTICTHITKFHQVLDVANRFDNIWCTVGIHPHNVGKEPETPAAALMSMAESPKVVAFGETGLDFFYERSGREIQEKSFRAHIKAARQSGLPVIIHARDADQDLTRILRDEIGNGVFPGVIHCFSSGPEIAALAIECGLYISISGILTFKSAAELRETVKYIPLDRLLIETDAPYLAPVPMRGKRNEPAYVTHTAKALALIKGVELSELAAVTTNNFFSLFAKAGAKVKTAVY